MSSTSEKGTVSGVILAGISLVTIIGAIVGLAVTGQNVTTESQARVVRSDVRLVKNSVSGVRVDDRTIRLFGDFCYTRYLQTGGAENWTLYPSNDRGTVMKAQSGSKHIDTGKVYVSAGGDFPAHCKTVDENTGEAEWQVKNMDSMQPHSFSFEVRLPEKLEGDYCPDVYLNYRGTWMSGVPFAKIALSKVSGICKPNPTLTPPPPTPLPSRAVSPPAVPLTPAAAPTTSPRAISGYITVYGCKKPEFVSVVYCKDSACKEKQSLRYDTPTEKVPVPNGVWLEDTNTDNTWVYRYSMTLFDGKPLEPATSYRLLEATATFNNNTLTLKSKAEDPRLLTLKPESRRDFHIYAEQTCSCPIRSVAYIKDAKGNFITSLDDQGGVYGVSNTIQFAQNPSRPAAGFKNGRIIVGPGNYTELFDPQKYGLDAMASTKLFAPGWKVIKQECLSNGAKPACPELAPEYSKTADKLTRPEIFEHLRVSCGVDLEYGWIIEQLPTPTPIPPTAVPTPSDLFSNISCSMRDDRNAGAAQNTGCHPRNLRGREDENKQTVKEASINIKWDVPASCPAFKEGTDYNMIVITRISDGVIVAAKRNVKDESTNVDPTNQDWDTIPGRKEVIRYFDKGIRYRVYVYSYLKNDRNCVSKPVTYDFVGIGKDGDPDDIKNGGAGHPQSDEKDTDSSRASGGGGGNGCESSRNERCTGTTHGRGNDPDHGQQMCDATVPGSQWVGWCHQYNDSCCRASGGTSSQPPATQPGSTNPPANPPAGNQNGPRVCTQGYTTLQAAAQYCEANGGAPAGLIPMQNPDNSDQFCCSRVAGSGLTAQSSAIKQFDIDDNGTINIADLSVLIDNYGELKQNFTLEDSQKSPDFNNDGIVNSLDYAALIQYLGTEISQ